MKDWEANVCGAVAHSHAAEFMSRLHNELLFMSTLMRSHEIGQKEAERMVDGQLFQAALNSPSSNATAAQALFSTSSTTSYAAPFRPAFLTL